MTRPFPRNPHKLIPSADPYELVHATSRRLKKIDEAKRLRALSPSETLEMGFDLMTFAREFAEAADRARR